MRGLIRYAWRSLIARPGRTSLTVAAIALGVGVLVAGLATNAGLDRSIARTTELIAGRADLRVESVSESGLSAETVETVAATSGVAVAAPLIERRAYIAPDGNQSLPGKPVAVVGIDPAREPAVRDLQVVDGTALTSADQPGALITERIAVDERLGVGSDVTLLASTEPVRVRVVGILAGDGPFGPSDGRTIVVALRAAARLDGAATDAAAGERVTRVDLVLAAGSDVTAVTSSLEKSLTGEPYTLVAPADEAASLRSTTSSIRATTALIAAIALFAGAFLIVNSLSMTIRERVRELGLLRAAGARGRQIVLVVGVQAAVLGVVGSALGLVVGTVLATFVAASLRATGSVGIDAPDLSAATLVVAFAIGVGVTLVASIEPARLAAHVSPVDALRARGDSASAFHRPTRWLAAVLATVALVAAFVMPAGTEPGGEARAMSVYSLLLAGALLSPVLLVPLGRLAGLPFAVLLGLEERLARAAILRDRGRAGLTVGALAIGLATIVALSAVATNARQAANAWLTDVVPGDEVLTAVAPVPLDATRATTELDSVPGVARATPIATFDLGFDGTRLDAAAVVGADLLRDGRLVFEAGDRSTALSALDAGGSVILPAARADVLGLGLGDTLTVAATDGTAADLAVVGIVDRSFPGRGGDAVIVGWPDATARFGVAGADAFAVRYAPGAPPEAHAAVHRVAARSLLTPTPLDHVDSTVGETLDQIFGLFDLLGLIAVVVAVLGVANTLSIGVSERGREIGVLRAAGMSRRQVWRSILVEAGILGVVAAVIGSVAGRFLGGVLVVTAGGGKKPPPPPPPAAGGGGAPAP